MKLVTIITVFVLIQGSILFASNEDQIEKSTQFHEKNVLVFTDGEVDDMVSLSLLGSHVKNGTISNLMVVASGFQTDLTAEIINKFYKLHGVEVSVYAGESIENKTCPEISSISSALSFSGKNDLLSLLDENLSLTKENFTNREPSKLNSCNIAIKNFLTEYSDTEILVLTTPFDLVAAFQSNEDLLENIKSVHMTGGWRELDTQNTGISTFNWNINREAASKLLDFGLDIMLYSTHNVSKFMPEFNEETHSTFFKTLNENNTSTANFIKLHMKLWNVHTIRNYPILKDKITPHIESQMCSSDIIATIGLLREDFIKENSFVSINTPIGNDLLEKKGYLITMNDCDEDRIGSIRLVTKIDQEIFLQEISDKL